MLLYIPWLLVLPHDQHDFSREKQKMALGLGVWPRPGRGTKVGILAPGKTLRFLLMIWKENMDMLGVKLD